MSRARPVLTAVIMAVGSIAALTAGGSAPDARLATDMSEPPPSTIVFAPADPTVVEAPPTTATPPPPPATTPVTRRVVAAPKGDGVGDKNRPDTRAKPKPAPVPLGTPFVGKLDGADIEGYARYEPQTTCDPAAKPGTVALRDLLLARYPNTSSSGIGRGCDVGGTSEHKEGRAFDWGANVTNAAQRAAVDDFIAALFATDAFGHKHALARRMGIMYVIWNNQIWGAYSADAGWRPYSGDSPHTDHVHISMSWAGARGETSFWSGRVVPGLPDGSRPTRPSRPTTTTRPRTTTTRRVRPSTTTSTSMRPPTTTTSSTTSIPASTTSTTRRG